MCISAASGKSSVSKSRLFPLGGVARRCIARYAASSRLANRKNPSISFDGGFAGGGTSARRRRMGGISLVELIIFIVVVSVGIAGILPVFNRAVFGSADPMQRKQAIAIAESLLTEITQQAFTFCDPADPAVFTARNTGDCTGGAAGSQDNLLGPTPASETRLTFNNVADYAGMAVANIPDASGANAMAGYAATVTITRVGNAAPFAAITDPGAVLRIVVRVTRGNDDVTLTGFRFRYAPTIPG